ncbi:MAG: peroxidase [Nitrospinae bacterium]|nr:peroxidase [Nitrospinota bacterium]
MHGESLRGEVNDNALVGELAEDYRCASLDAPTRLLLEYAEQITRDATKITKGDIDRLRGVGFSDKDILEATHIAAYFNYVDRLADALGVELDEAFRGLGAHPAG